MKKGFSLLRFLFGLGLVIILGMIYWSSILQEKDLKSLQKQVIELTKEVKGVRLEAQKLKTRSLTQSNQEGVSKEQISSRSWIDPQYPNQLVEDPFDQVTLPEILGKDFIPQGIRREALLGKPEHLHPFNGFHDVANMTSMCSGSVAQLQFGKYETLSPSMAIKVEARPIPEAPTAVEYWVHLRENLYWQPLAQEHFPDGLQLSPHFLQKHPVTANDFKFFYDAIMNPNISEPKAASLRNYYSDIEELRVIDPLTFVVRWKRQLTSSSESGEIPKIKYTALGLTGSLQPLPEFVFKYFADGQKILDDDQDPDTYRYNSVWAQNFSHHFAKNIIVSCGPWIFNGMNEEGIKFKRNPDYFDPYAVLVEGLHYTFKESFDAIWQDFKAGKIDLCVLAPNQLAEMETFLKSDVYKEQVKKGLKINELDFVDKSFYYIGWNEATPYFSSQKARLAMTLAIDRKRIIEQNLNNMGVTITGPLFCYSPAYDSSIQGWPYDPLEAQKLLDEEGWIDINGDGIRDKMIDGKRVPFRFSLVYYAKNVSTKVICEYIATALKDIGVDCQLRGLDVTDLSHAFEDKDFDAVYMGWTLGTPPEDPRQLWHSSGAKEKGSSNAIGFMNTEVDHIIDELNYEYDKEKRNLLYHRFHQIIHEEAPYSFLYSPKRRLLSRNYVKNLFIPRDRQDLVPGADIPEPDFRVIYLAPHEGL